jgi:hypothetical protein
MDSAGVGIAVVRTLGFADLLRVARVSRGVKGAVDDPSLWRWIADTMGWKRDADSVPILKSRVKQLLVVRVADAQLTLAEQMDAWLNMDYEAVWPRATPRAQTTLGFWRGLFEVAPGYHLCQRTAVITELGDPWLLEELHERGGGIFRDDVVIEACKWPNHGHLLVAVARVKPTAHILKAAVAHGNGPVITWCMQAGVRPNEAVVQSADLNTLRFLAQLLKKKRAVFALAARAGSLPLANLLWAGGSRPTKGELVRMEQYREGPQITVAQWVRAR